LFAPAKNLLMNEAGLGDHKLKTEKVQQLKNSVSIAGELGSIPVILTAKYNSSSWQLVVKRYCPFRFCEKPPKWGGTIMGNLRLPMAAAALRGSRLRHFVPHCAAPCKAYRQFFTFQCKTKR
ncbi:MAG: hypothetical protein RR263_02285, partial [Oscillospiraceae bacterium]